MKFRIRLFLWLSSLLAAVAVLLLGWIAPRLLPDTGGNGLGAAYFNAHSAAYWSRGLITMGLLLLLLSSLLFLLGKKLKTPLYTGLFLLLILISAIAGSAVATF